MRRGVGTIAVFACAGALVLARPYVFPTKPLEVHVFRVARGEVRETVTSPSSGTVVSAHEATVAAEATGRVARLLLKAGDRAVEGTPVVLLEDADAAVEVRAAEAALATRRTALEAAELRAKKAEADLASAEPLYQKKLISDEQQRVWRTTRDTAVVDVETARRAAAESEVAVERARVVLAKRSVRAPFAGLIRRKLVEAGEHVVTGQPCFEVFDDARIFVRAPIDEVDIPRIAPGMPVDVALEPFPGKLFKGVIREIEPGVRAAKELNRTGEVEVDLVDAPQAAAEAAPDAVGGAADAPYIPPAGPLRVGMSADIEIITRTHPAVLRVPAYAVHEDDVERYVFSVGAEGKIARRTVKTGLSNWDYAEIVDGLSEGEPVVVSLDLKDLAPGKPATIVREVTAVRPQ